MEEILKNTLNTICEGVIITDDLYKIIYINHKLKNEIIHIFENDIHGIHIATLFNEFSILEQNKIYRNKKITVSLKKKICGSILYASLSDIDNDIIYNVNINTIVNNYIFIFNNINDKSINDTTSKKQNNFVAFLSHELRNPLQSIILSNFLLNKELKEINITDKMKKQLVIMEKSCNDMRKIISDILDLSKIEANEISIDINNCDIRQLINDLVIIHSNDYEIHFNISENVPNILITDEIRLNQILTNLLINAIKYTNNNKKKIMINVLLNNNYINFEVIDNGIGIKEDELNNLFTEFSKTSNNNKINCNSNGLGLCISQKMAKLLGGYISVKSEYNKGSIFTMHHPIDLLLNNHNIININTNTNIKGKILIIDDNDSNLSLLQMLMEHFNQDLGYDLEVHAVSSGYEAIKICQINNYNLIFLDINMTGMDGCTTCKMIKKENIKIIATTGNILANDSTNNKYSCFDDVLIKPYDNVMVLNMIKKYIIV